MKKRLIEFKAMREWEEGSWLAQLDCTLKKAGKSRSVVSSAFVVTIFLFCSSFVKVQEHDEAEPEHDALQVPEDPVWLGTLVTSPSGQRLSTQILEQRRLELRRRAKEKWANCVPLAVRIPVRSLVRVMQKCCWPWAR